MKHCSIGFLVCLLSTVVLGQTVRKEEEVHRICRGHEVREKYAEACAFLGKRSTEDKRNHFIPLYTYGKTIYVPENRNWSPFFSKFGQPIKPLSPLSPAEPMRPDGRLPYIRGDWDINERRKRQDVPKELLDKCCYRGCTYYDFDDVC